MADTKLNTFWEDPMSRVYNPETGEDVYQIYYIDNNGNRQLYGGIVKKGGKAVRYETYSSQPSIYFINQFGLNNKPYVYNGQTYMSSGGAPYRVTQDEATGEWKRLDDNLIEKFKKDWDDIKRLNEERYGNILKGYDDRYTDAMKNLEGLGLQQSKDIDTSFGRAQAKAKADMTSRGLVNTTVLPSVMTGYDRERVAAQSRLGEELRREKLGYQTGLLKEKFDFMERRTDTYPGLDLFTLQLQNLGKGGM